jgi:hypothetical protein
MRRFIHFVVVAFIGLVVRYNLISSNEIVMSAFSILSCDCLRSTGSESDENGVAAQDLHDDVRCFPWSIQVDEWWTNHVEYEEGKHNDTHQCFNRLTNSGQIAQYYQIHRVQFQSDCSQVTVRPMWSSGWGADLYNIATGLKVAVRDKIPLQMSVCGRWWHYSAIKESGENATCPAKDMTCYFLPLSRCNNSHEVKKEYEVFAIESTEQRWLIDLVSRSQQWLRKRVHFYMRDNMPKIEGQCSVIHVRRSDVAFHGTASRKYYPISDYIDKLPPERRAKGANVLLLTDDANAVNEALDFFPDLHWHYLDRPRHRGTQGGWENQVPSKDPALEVIIIKATFRMVQLCDVIVHGAGAFSDALHDAMANVHNVLRLRVEGNASAEAIHNNKENTESPEELEKLLEEKRKKLNLTIKG